MEAVGDIVDIAMIGDDLAGQGGPLFFSEFCRAFVKPRHRRLVQHIRSLTKAKIWYHTCGSSVEFIKRSSITGGRAVLFYQRPDS